MRPMTASRSAPMAWDHVGSGFRRLAKRTSAERDRSVHAMDRDIALFDVGCHGLTVVEKAPAPTHTTRPDRGRQDRVTRCSFEKGDRSDDRDELE